jgi:hypothetical protein
MNRDRLFDQVKDEVHRYIEEAPTCQLMVVSTFGTTADIRAGRFLLTLQDRAELQAAVAGLRADQDWTNFDEAIKHLEWLVAKIESAYGAGAGNFSMRVVALSDDEPSPSPEKPPNTPSLREWLQEHFPGGQLSATVVRVTTERTAATAAMPGSRTGTVLVSDLGHVFNQGQGTTRAVNVGARVNKPQPVLIGRLDHANAWIVAHPRTFAALCVVLALASLALAYQLCMRDDPKLLLPQDLLEDQASLDEAPSALAVQQVELPADGKFGEPRFGPEREVPIAIGVPAIFSADPMKAAVLVESVEGIEGELARVTALPGGANRVESGFHGLLCNGEPISAGGALFCARDRFRLRLPAKDLTLEWIVTPKFSSDNPAVVAALFAIPTAKEGESP